MSERRVPVKIAYKLLVNDKGEFAALLMGITFSVFLMIQMTSMFAGIIKKASATVVNTGASIWVMDRAVRNVSNDDGTYAVASSS